MSKSPKTVWKIHSKLLAIHYKSGAENIILCYWSTDSGLVEQEEVIYPRSARTFLSLVNGSKFLFNNSHIKIDHNRPLVEYDRGWPREYTSLLNQRPFDLYPLSMKFEILLIGSDHWNKFLGLTDHFELLLVKIGQLWFKNKSNKPKPEISH